MLSNRAPVFAAPNSANGRLIDTMPFGQHGTGLCGLVDLNHLVKLITVFVLDVLQLP